jgi:hypothetical protein
MSARKIALTKDGSVVVMRGWRIADLARQAGLKPIYVGTVQAWLIDAGRLPDLVSWLEYRNVRYELTGDDEAPLPAACVAGQPAATPSDPEQFLW